VIVCSDPVVIGRPCAKRKLDVLLLVMCNSICERTLLKVRTILPSFRDIAQFLHIVDFVFIVSYFFLMSFERYTYNINFFLKFLSLKHHNNRYYNILSLIVVTVNGAANRIE